MSEKLREITRRKLADEPLQKALQKALGQVRTKSAAALEELCDAPAQAELAGRIKHECVNRLAENLVQLEERLEAAGTRVLWARDAAEARSLVVDIARRHEVTRTVLSKTMVGEEVRLEHGLKAAGINVLQTDLGERVVQLAHQTPSHITAPILHMSAAEVGEVLHKKAGIPYSDDAETLCRALGKNLRPGFFNAQMGITGANVAVADDGLMVQVENEGNVRMGYTLPPVHVVLLGVEKVVRTLPEAHTVLSLLSRKATGQRATCYVSLLAPSPLAGQTRYVVLVDNGRTALFNGGAFRDLLRCIRCGACMNVCPVYERVGGHAYLWTYPGPIGIAMAPHMAPPETGAVAPLLCTLCGACTEACPVRIPLDRLIVLARGVAHGLRPAGEVRKERRAFRYYRWAMRGRAGYRLSHWGHKQSLHTMTETAQGIQRRMGWYDDRRPPAPAGVLFRTWWRRRRQGRA